MIRALYAAATGMKAQETNIDVISNNLANVNTTGFKKSRADFQDLMYQYVTEPGAPTSQTTINPTGIQVGLGVKTAAVQKLFTQGDLSSTGNQFDIAIEGEVLPVVHKDLKGLPETLDKKGYWIGAKVGGVFKTVTVSDKKGVSHKEDKVVYEYTMRAIRHVRSSAEGNCLVINVFHPHDGTIEFILPMKVVY